MESPFIATSPAVQLANRKHLVNLNPTSAVIVFLFIAAVMGIGVWTGSEPAVALLLSLLMVVGFVCAWKFHMVLIAGLLFIGIFKSQGATEISFRDPTLLLLALLAGAVVCQVLVRSRLNERVAWSGAIRGELGAVVAFLVLVAAVTISYLYTPAPISGANKLERFAAFVPVVFFSPLLLLHNEKQLKSFAIINLVLSLFLAFRSVLELMHTSPMAMELAGKGDITRIGDAQLIGSALVMLLYYKFVERHATLVTLVCIPILIVGLISCAARGPLVSLVIAVIFGFITVGKSYVPPKVVLIGFVLGLVVAVFSTLWIEKFPAARDKFMHKEAELALLSNLEDPGGTAGQRLQFYSRAWEGIKEKPILGWGVGAWVTYYYGYDSTAEHKGAKLAFLTTYPHNLILEVAFEQGLFGLAALLSLIILAFRRLVRLPKVADGRFAFMYPLFLYCLLAGMFSEDINNRVLWTWCGMVFAVSHLATTEAKAPAAHIVAMSEMVPRLLPCGVPQIKRPHTC